MPTNTILRVCDFTAHSAHTARTYVMCYIVYRVDIALLAAALGVRTPAGVVTE